MQPRPLAIKFEPRSAKLKWRWKAVLCYSWEPWSCSSIALWFISETDAVWFTATLELANSCQSSRLATLRCESHFNLGWVRTFPGTLFLVRLC
ncbi:hypothetical protein E2C01_010636 [Portunus trituberculatus]|uniref:Uncharacterized protein n=1 Tax=Portunus trituberculatus TaxID=210409 RepID=A0A5B7D8Y1_PORTR|nr:hypothetical protein [Portunus trituberculatus]